MKIAICICTYNRAELFERLLLSLQHMRLGRLDPRDVRVIVVDNCPDGRTRAVCDRISGRLPVLLEFTEESHRGLSYARNRAVDEALSRGDDFVVFIDDDDLPEPDQSLCPNALPRAADFCGLWLCVRIEYLNGRSSRRSSR